MLARIETRQGIIAYLFPVPPAWVIDLVAQRAFEPSFIRRLHERRIPTVNEITSEVADDAAEYRGTQEQALGNLGGKPERDTAIPGRAEHECEVGTRNEVERIAPRESAENLECGGWVSPKEFRDGGGAGSRNFH
jgi:hypothetical protein